jgi:hypothetical protein
MDKVVRFCYFTICWACILQLTNFSNSPISFHTWNSIITILFSLFVLTYPALMYFILRRRSNTVSDTTFDKVYA